MRTQKSFAFVLIRILLGASALTLGAASCSRGEHVLGDSITGGSDQGFGSVDSGDAAATTEAGDELVSYCPSNKCPSAFTTCPSSRFPCDVNLQNDRDNCGVCGNACPADTLRETYECVEGHCTLRCLAYPMTLDCDGVVDNGCETDPGTNDNCAACGDTCLDPAKPCMDPGIVGVPPRCGCGAGETYCPDSYPQCPDLKTNDYNCGGCGTRCDQSIGNDGGPPPANAYYGCDDGQCGAVKCNPNWANCDGDMANGCETNLFSQDDCGTCGTVCPAGTQCKGDANGLPMCACPAGQTYCEQQCFGDTCMGTCVDLASDVLNCGACGFRCGSAWVTRTISFCSFGTCDVRCSQGRADCNGNASDDCEVDTDSDPRNCGGCGIQCDAVAGQACVGGRCVVEPCPDAAIPGETR